MLKFFKKGETDTNKKSRLKINLSKKEKILIGLIFIFILGSIGILSYLLLFKDTENNKKKHYLKRKQMIAVVKEKKGKYNTTNVSNQNIKIGNTNSLIMSNTNIKDIKNKSNQERKDLKIENQSNDNVCKLLKPIKNYEDIFKDFYIKKYLKEKKEIHKEKSNVKRAKTSKRTTTSVNKRNVKSKKSDNKKDLKIKAIYCTDICYAITEDNIVIKDGQKINGKIAKISPSGVQFK